MFQRSENKCFIYKPVTKILSKYYIYKFGAKRFLSFFHKITFYSCKYCKRYASDIKVCSVSKLITDTILIYKRPARSSSAVMLVYASSVP